MGCEYTIGGITYTFLFTDEVTNWPQSYFIGEPILVPAKTGPKLKQYGPKPRRKYPKPR